MPADPPKRPTPVRQIPAQLIALVLSRPGDGRAGFTLVGGHTEQASHVLAGGRDLQASVLSPLRPDARPTRIAMSPCIFHGSEAGTVSHVRGEPALQREVEGLLTLHTTCSEPCGC